MDERRRATLGAAAPLCWAGGALVVSFTPAAQAAPFLLAFRGPLGFGLAALALGLTLAQVLRGRVRIPEPSPAALFATGAVFFVALGFSYTSRLRVSGDEPHYLLMAQSLWRERDLDLRDNLQREDWREYTPGPVAPHWGAPRADGRPHPAHAPGLPLVLAPIYALGGRRACAALIGLAAAALAVQTRRLALLVGAASASGLLAWAAALGPPVLFYSFHVYTEVPAALAMAVALNLLMGPARQRRDGRAAAAAAAAGFFAGALPVVHVKMSAAAAALAVVAIVQLRGGARAAFALAAGAVAAVYLTYLQHVYGRPSPLAAYDGVPAQLSGGPVTAAAGLLFDRSFGLLPHAPVFVLALAGLPLLLRRWREVWPALAVAAAAIAPVLFWRMWWGGQCPPARFLVPVVPILAAAVAFEVGKSPRGLARWAWPLTVIGLAVALFASADPGRLLLLNRGDRPTRLWAALAPAQARLGEYFPSLVAGTLEEWRVAGVWLAALALLVTLDAVARRRDGCDRLFRSLALPVILVLLGSITIDRWARPAASPAVSAFVLL